RGSMASGLSLSRTASSAPRRPLTGSVPTLAAPMHRTSRFLIPFSTRPADDALGPWIARHWICPADNVSNYTTVPDGLWLPSTADGLPAAHTAERIGRSVARHALQHPATL